jgi:hypothetical protein
METVIFNQTYELTKHASRRMGQRGINFEMLELVISNFNQSKHRGNGVDAIAINSKGITILKKLGISQQLLDRVKTIVILLKGKTIITIMRNTSKSPAYYKSPRGHYSFRY